MPTWTTGPSRGWRRPGVLGRRPTATRPRHLLAVTSQNLSEWSSSAPHVQPLLQSSNIHTHKLQECFSSAPYIDCFMSCRGRCWQSRSAPGKTWQMGFVWKAWMSVAWRKTEKTSNSWKILTPSLYTNWLMCQLCSSSALKPHRNYDHYAFRNNL